MFTVENQVGKFFYTLSYYDNIILISDYNQATSSQLTYHITTTNLPYILSNIFMY